MTRTPWKKPRKIHKLYKPMHFPSYLAPLFTTVLFILFGGAFWICLTTTLDEMTKQACRDGDARACMQVIQNKLDE